MSTFLDALQFNGLNVSQNKTKHQEKLSGKVCSHIKEINRFFDDENHQLSSWITVKFLCQLQF